MIFLANRYILNTVQYQVTCTKQYFNYIHDELYKRVANNGLIGRAHQRFITRQKDMTIVKYICSKMSAQDTHTQQAPYNRKNICIFSRN